MTLEDIIYFLLGADNGLPALYSRNLFWLEFFAAVASILLITGIVYVILRLNIIGLKIERFIDILGVSDMSKRRTVRGWIQIKKRLKFGDEANLKLAVIEADKILDELLKLSGYRGETMADRLKQITPAALSNIEKVWAAHKLRNRLVHEPDYHLSRSDTEEAIFIYDASFREMGLID